MRISGFLGLFLSVFYVQADTSEDVAVPCKDLRVEIENAVREKDDLVAKLAATSAEVDQRQQKLIEYDVAYNQLQVILETCNSNLNQAQGTLASCETSKQQSKQVDELKTLLTTMTQERDTLSAENLNIVQKNQALAADVAIKTSELDASAAAAKQLKTQLDSQKNLSENSKKELGSCSSAQTGLKKELDSIKSDHSRKLQVAKSEVDLLTKETATLKRELSDSRGKIYTASQFWTHAEHTKVVSMAFFGFARNRLIKLIGDDTYKLINLQARIWYKKSAEGFNTVYRPVSTSVKIHYDRYARAHLNQVVAMVKGHLDGPMKQIQQHFGRGIGFVESYMDGVVNNLSSVDPNVRDLFPTNFYDRCYAFAFISLVFYFASEFVQYVMGMVWTGITSVFGSKQKAKSSNASSKRKLSGAAGGKPVGSKQSKKDTSTKSTRS